MCKLLGPAWAGFLNEDNTMSLKEEMRALKREHILAKAEQLFFERGYRATSLDAIAEALDMTKPFVYGVFEKKSDILAEIYLRILNRSLQVVDNAMALKATPTEKLRSFAVAFTELSIEKQGSVAIFFREEGSLDPDKAAEFNRLKGDFDARLARLLEEGVKAGEFVIEDTRLASLAIGGLISWVYIWYRRDGRLSGPVISKNMANYALAIAGAKSR